MKLSLRAPAGALILLLAGAVAGSSSGNPLQPASAAAASAQTTLSRVPLYFVENRGQSDPAVAFYTHGSDAGVYFTRTGITFALSGSETAPATATRPKRVRPDATRPGAIDPAGSLPEPRRRWTIKVDFVGANPSPAIEGVDLSPCTFNYFQGRPSEWETGVPSFLGVRYRDLWPGIDLVYYGSGPSLKYDFVVRPGADPNDIQLRYRGSQGTEIGDQGRLLVRNPIRTLVDEAPTAYAEEGADRTPVSAGYQVRRIPAKREGAVLRESATILSFKVGEYDRGQTLVIDPAVLLYCGYIGGAMGDTATAIAVDGVGSAYVCGTTSSSGAQGFPVTVGPDLTHNSSYDAFVAKVNPNGAGFVYCGYIGGLADDGANGIAVDRLGNAYVGGFTGSSENQGFPVAVGPDLTYGGQIIGDYNGFVAKVGPQGDQLSYCGYIGGGFSTNVMAVAVDGRGSAYVTGFTNCAPAFGFPVVVGPSLNFSGGDADAFVAKVEPTGAVLLYCGYIGGASGDYGSGIAVDDQGNAYVSGTASSSHTTFPVVAGPDLTFNGGQYDAFAAKVAPGGSSLLYCGYIGGSQYDWGYGIAVDALGAAYLAGRTYSTPAMGFPVAVGPDLTYNGDSEGFVAKLTSDGVGLSYCGYLGGSSYDYALAVAVDDAGNAYVTGGAHSSKQQGFPVADGPDLTQNGSLDAYVARLRLDGTGFVYCGYIGGANGDFGAGIAVDAGGGAYICGQTYSSAAAGFPIIAGPDLTFAGAYDGFVAKIAFAAIAPPTDLTATAVSLSGVLLVWVDEFAAASPNRYIIQRRRNADAGGGFVEIARTDAGVLTYSDTGLSANTTYTYRVRAFNAMGESPFSNEATVTTPAGDLEAPTDLTAVALTSTRVGLTWAHSGMGTVRFRVEQAGDDGVWVNVWDDTDIVHVVVTVKPNSTYTYRVRAFNMEGVSEPSAEVSVTTPSAPGRLSVRPGFLNFGKAKVEREKTKRLKIRNVGEGALFVSFIPPATPFAAEQEGKPGIFDRWGRTLAPKESLILTVRFAPTAAGVFEQILIVNSDDPETPNFPCRLLGLGR